mmetsp:Transcript_72980/g.208007  ORF Transcript_72980/g.208007 Transcript_72980/m.208007 type:complete len:263 (+) Transcript_72980:926-1714(+)
MPPLGSTTNLPTSRGPVGGATAPAPPLASSSAACSSDSSASGVWATIAAVASASPSAPVTVNAKSNWPSFLMSKRRLRGSSLNLTAPNVTPRAGWSRNMDQLDLTLALTSNVSNLPAQTPSCGSEMVHRMSLLSLSSTSRVEQNVTPIVALSPGSITPSAGSTVKRSRVAALRTTKPNSTGYLPLLASTISCRSVAPTRCEPKSRQPVSSPSKLTYLIWYASALIATDSRCTRVATARPSFSASEKSMWRLGSRTCSSIVLK